MRYSLFEVSIRNSEFYVEIRYEVIYYIKIQLTCAMNNIYYTYLLFLYRRKSVT